MNITQYSNSFRLSSVVFYQKPRNTDKGLGRLINSHKESIQINHDLFIVQPFKCNFFGCFSVCNNRLNFGGALNKAECKSCELGVEQLFLHIGI